MIDGLHLSDTLKTTNADFDSTLKRLAPRWFVVQNTHASSGVFLVQPRYAISLMRGPMTRNEIREAREARQPRTPVAPRVEAGCGSAFLGEAC